MKGVKDIKSIVKDYAEDQYRGGAKFKRVEMEGEFGFVGVNIQTGIVMGTLFALALHLPSETVVAEEDLGEWGFVDMNEKMNDKIDEWINMTEQERRSTFTYDA